MKHGMARKYFEQMLLDELELGNYQAFQRWYATQNSMCYSLPDMSHDFRNVTRFNRCDLHVFDYYRQPYWMVDRAKTSDFVPQFERRYQPGWSRDSQHYQLPRDDRNASRLSYRNSNTDLCTEDMIIDQHLQNFKQMFKSRNSSSDSLSMSESLTQTGNALNVTHAGSAIVMNYAKSSELDRKDQIGKGSKNHYADSIQYPMTSNFSNSYESWYCPEEQQQIIDMLKEVNLRHDRQLKRDMLLSRGEQPCSEESISRAVPPILEATNESEESLKSGYHEKSASDFFEEFQNIFTGSPEKKIINNLTKESLKNPLTEQDEEFQVAGKVITEDDKNAVKAVLDFDHLDDVTEKTFSGCPSMSTSSPKENCCDQVPASENSAPPSKDQSNSCRKYSDEDQINNKALKTLTTSLKPLALNTRTHGIKAEIDHNGNSCLTSCKESARNRCSNDKRQVEEVENSTNQIKSHTCSSTELSTDSAVLSLENNIRNNDDSLVATPKNISVTQCNKMRSSKENSCSKLHPEVNSCRLKYRKQEKENRSLLDRTKNCIAEKKPEVLCPDNISKENCPQTVNENKFSNQNNTSYRTIQTPLLSNKGLHSNIPLYKEESGLSASEPVLIRKADDVVYKRISISEIFSSISPKSEEDFERLPNSEHQIGHINQKKKPTYLSPTEHLKQILGIGNNSDSNRSMDCTPRNISSHNPSPDGNEFLKESKSIACFETKSTTLQDNQDISQTSVTQTSPKYPCCMPVPDSSTEGQTVIANQLELPSRVPRCEISKNKNNSNKRKKSVIEDNSGNTISTNSVTSVDECDVGISRAHFVISKHATEYNKRATNTGNEIFHKKKELSREFSQHNKYCELKPGFAEESWKLKYKLTNGVQKITQNASQPQQKNNDLHHNGNYVNKSTREQPEETSTRYVGRKETYKSNSGPFMPPDSQIPSSNGKEPEKSLVKIKSKLDSPKTKKKFKKKKRKEKLIDEHNNQEINSKPIQCNKDGRDNKQSTSRDVPDAPSKQTESSPIRKKESFQKKSRHSTGFKYSRNFISASECAPENTYHSENHGNENSLANSNEKLLNSTSGDKKSVPVSSINISETKIDTNNFERKSYTASKPSRLKENQIKYDLYEKENEAREGTGYWKNRNDAPNRSYVSEERKIPPSSYNDAKKGKEQKRVRYSKNVYSGENIPVKEIIFYGNNRKSFIEDSKLSNEQNTTRNETGKDYIDAPTFEESSSSNNYINGTEVEAHTPSSELLDEICRCARSNATFINRIDSDSSANNVSIIRSNFDRSLAMNSSFLALMFEIRYKTQQMLEKAEKIVFLVSERNYKLAALRESRLNANRKRQMYRSNNSLVFSKKDYLAPKMSNTDISGNPISYIDENTEVSRISCKPSKKIVLCTLGIQDNSEAYFTKEDHTKEYLKRKKDKHKSLVSAVSTAKITEKKCLVVHVCAMPEKMVIVVAPKVIDNYMRNKQALKLSPLYDIYVQVELSDFFSEFNSVKLSTDLQTGLQLSLNTVIDENLFNSLPLFLNLLSLLYAFHLPWSRNNLKKLLDLGYHDKEKTEDVKVLKVFGDEISQNCANGVLKCWDILSRYFKNKIRET